MNGILKAMASPVNQIVNGANKAGQGSPAKIEPLALNLINLAIYAVGIIAVVMIVFAGVQYATSQGDGAKTKKAKDTIMYAVIGLIVAILAFSIVNFVLKGVFFSPVTEGESSEVVEDDE
jgi:cytochrome bd-type quinol oxidase subunit 2